MVMCARIYREGGRRSMGVVALRTRPVFFVERKPGGMALRTERILDDVGWRILGALQADARLSFSELGRRIGLSAPAVAERVRRMEEAGIIAGYRVEVALDKLFPITAIIRVSAPEENCARLGACVRGLPEVVQSYRVTGTDRQILKVVARSVQIGRASCRERV